MTKDIRVRFAPSPTGPLHIGGVRTALFNYLFAKQHNGTFVLRIEDTDQNRYVPGAEDYIKEALDWCSIPFDEGPGKDGGFGPYRQSERKHLYKQYADQLIKDGHAYFAFDTTEALDSHRKDHEANGKTFIYNWHNREKLTNSLSLSEDEVSAKINSGEPYVIRFKSPKDEILKFTDEIRGDISIDTNILDDKILFKSDGMPTYHLANIVDDHLMKITHVIRGEEWLPSLALHVLLYRSFNWEAPSFAHLPLILKPVGKGKLSKRDGDKMGFPVFPLQWVDPKSQSISSGYREDGYLPEAVVNMLAFLGWNPGTEQELFSLQELIKEFDLKRVNKAGAKFDPEKTKWFQQQQLQKIDSTILSQQFEGILSKKNISTTLDLNVIIDTIKERATFTKDFWDLSHFYFLSPSEYDEKAIKKAWKQDTPGLMHELTRILNDISDFSEDNVSTIVKGWITGKEIGFGKIMMPLRIALVGSLQGPDLFQIASMIGKKETIKRIENAIEKN
ncbi:glutamyl-tRNA synthetase [Aquimarina sp. EL_43]|uniref:glutamate--tRNA ligase n=1 Tax=unclassified Aquimarina TaxID=2627091 RepID=UPI0018CB6779|nr:MULTISPECIES: glutamate--tRNA ligase [unclassified Aquimarina]MBG6133066.1 glutamyl-tRNA synthetase [Aquimarina sp. EL_35]MBG6153224.1 glutamyl-tRNA synthetase [Aquimarina sp. EL_32]MBG6171507.1 glutamyl-tRNA synthetase [Aquimarina sp. EL_43]